MEACHTGDLQQVEQLLGTSDPNAESAPPADSSGKQQPKLGALVFAADQGHETIVAKLLEQEPKDSHLLSALMHVARSGDDAVAKLLLASSPALATRTDEKNNLAIHKAAQYPRAG